eukprot:Skav223194  [mRNA]  locus=scaffold1825:93875:94298:+ [translate_table: standard]
MGQPAHSTKVAFLQAIRQHHRHCSSKEVTQSPVAIHWHMPRNDAHNTRTSEHHSKLLKHLLPKSYNHKSRLP